MSHPFFLRQLKRLDLSENSLVEVPADFGILNSSLERLILAHNSLAQVSTTLCRGMAHLRQLDLSHNRIRELSDKIRELACLESLDLSFNQLTVLNRELCSDLKSLKELNLSNNTLDSLPVYNFASKRLKSSSAKSISGNLSASRLSMMTPSRSNLASASAVLPEKRAPQSMFTFNLPNLNKIDLSFNKLALEFNFYTAFSLCSKLKYINLNSNRIETLLVWNDDDDISTVPLDTQQFLNDDDVKAWSKPKNKLNELQSVNLSNNRIKFTQKGGFVQMLCEFYHLAPNLQAVYYDQLNGMKLGTKPPVLNSPVASVPVSVLDTKKSDIVQKDVQKVEPEIVWEEFNFDWSPEGENRYEAISSRASSARAMNAYQHLLEHLKVIDLSNNGLGKLPKLFYEMRNLTEIYFNENLLKKIPNELFQKPRSAEDEVNFQRLKHLQTLQERERARKARRELDPDYEEEEVLILLFYLSSILSL